MSGFVYLSAFSLLTAPYLYNLLFKLANCEIIDRGFVPCRWSRLSFVTPVSTASGTLVVQRGTLPSFPHTSSWLLYINTGNQHKYLPSITLVIWLALLCLSFKHFYLQIGTNHQSLYIWSTNETVCKNSLTSRLQALENILSLYHLFNLLKPSGNFTHDQV
jgi:hypothetical protein